MIKRKTDGSMVCPKCGKLISVNAKQCIHCGYKNPGLWGYAPFLQKVLANGSMVPLITGVAIILYVLAIVIDPGAIFQPRGLFGLLAPSSEALFHLGMTGTIPMEMGRWWTLITAIYLHGGVMHILFNMLWLRNLGGMVEQLFGTARSFLIFTIAGFVGFVASDLLGIPITVGASGSIFGLLGALVYYGRKRGGTFGNAIYRQVGTWTIVLFVFGFLFPMINNWAHAGGFIGGFIGAMVLGFDEAAPETNGHRLAALGVIGFTIICFGFAFYAWLVG